MSFYIGVDIGGTKTSVAVFKENIQCIAEKTFPTKCSLGALSLVERIADVYKVLLKENGIDASQIISVGVGCPGPLDISNGKIVYIATMDFKDVPIVKLLSKALDKPVYLENDANCAALAEAVLGVGKGMNPVAYITISTGIGCGIVIDGEILDGFSDCAGELGHITVERNGKACPCGKRGCLEMYSSGTAISKNATEKFGREISAKELFDLARNGDLKAEEIIFDAVDYLAFGISSLCVTLNPQIVVLGGSVTKDYDYFKDSLKQSLGKYLQSGVIEKTKFVLSEFDGSQVLYGAVLNAVNKEKAKAKN